MPTVKELGTIINYNIHPGQTINTNYFPNTQASFYWSSTSYAYYTYSAWGVNFYSTATTTTRDKRQLHTMSAPFAGDSHASISGYVDNGDGTVTDTSTGLMWQQAGPSSAMTWEQALAYCEELNLGGYTDWRLPTKKELRSLVDFSRYDPSINTTYFPDTVSSFYWSSTTDAYYYGLRVGRVLLRRRRRLQQ